MRQAELRRGVAHLRRTEPRLAPAIRRHGTPPLRRSRNHFESLAGSIVHQQLSGHVAGRILGRLSALAPGRSLPSPSALLATPDEALRSAGLSRQKAAALRDLAAHYADGRLSSRRLRGLSDDEIGELLLAVRGIGPWTVDMFLLFALNRLDVLPIGDLGIRKGFQELFGLGELPDAAKMESLSRAWRPYRSLGSWYLWRIADGGA
jgi:DNA-3-methyladenine glycosylase II